MKKTRDTMNKQGNLGLITGILLIGFILIGAVSASVIMNTTKNVSDNDLNKITNEVVDEITTILQIKIAVGKYQMINGEQRIQQIAILIKPLISLDIKLSHMTIQLSNGEQLYVLSYNGNAASISSYSVFNHPLWDTITLGTYSLLPTIDDDQSIITDQLINKNTDMAFILIKLPDDTAMKKGDYLDITILPSPGMGRTIRLEAPLPTTHIVTLYE
jgi:archaellin